MDENYILRVSGYLSKAGLLDRDDKVIVGGASCSNSFHDELGCITKYLLELILNVYEKNCSSSYEKMVAKTGFPEASYSLLEAISEGSVNLDTLARADIIDSEQGLKIVEINVGSQLGGFLYASLPRLCGLVQEHDVQKKWAEVVSKLIGNKTMVFLESSENIDLMEPYCTALSEDFKVLTGKSVPLVAAHQLTEVDGFLYFKCRRVDFLYLWMGDEDIRSCPEMFDHIRRAIKRKSVSVVICPLALVLAGKGVLAYLYELASKGLLSPEGKAFVYKYVAKTFWVNKNNAQEILERKSAYIIKPTHDFGGRGVMAGVDVNKTEWERAVFEILQSDNKKLFVVQEYIKSMPKVLELSNSAGEIESARCNVVWGSYIFGGRYIGSVVRGAPLKSGVVLNKKSGAYAGAAF